MQQILPIIEQILDSNVGIILHKTTVNNPIPTFTNHILISKTISGNLKLSESIPMAPPQVRDLWPDNRSLVTRPGLPTSMTRPGNPLRVRNPVVFTNFNMNSVLPSSWTLFLWLLKKQELGSGCYWLRLR